MSRVDRPCVRMYMYVSMRAPAETLPDRFAVDYELYLLVGDAGKWNSVKLYIE